MQRHSNMFSVMCESKMPNATQDLVSKISYEEYDLEAKTSTESPVEFEFDDKRLRCFYNSTTVTFVRIWTFNIRDLYCTGQCKIK